MLCFLEVFNTETVAQGQAVARLNILAFAFLPLSFVSVSISSPTLAGSLQLIRI